MRRSRAVVIALVASCFGSAACSAILGLEPPPPGDAGVTEAGTDSTASDGTAADSSGPHPDSGPDGGGDVVTDAPVCVPLVAGDAGDAATFYSLKDNWEFYEPDSVNVLSRDFQGGVFDGRYVYFVPNGSGTVTRYDTLGSFTSGSSWSTFDTTMLSPGAEDFAGAVYDGRYVYFVPNGSAAGHGGVIARHDTEGSFVQSSGWSIFDLTTLPVADAGTLAGFNGGVFDGQGVYFVPDYDGVARTSRVVRYEAGPPDAGAPDTGGPVAADGGDAGDAQPPPFATESQFQVFDLTVRNSSAEGYIGSAFDGRYVYFVPYFNVVGNSGIVARYSTSASFIGAGSWATLDLSALSPSAVGFVGAAFDGRYVYLVPHQKTVVARFDTQATTFADSAWTIFDVSQILATDAGLAGFQGAAFDGRFVYFVPGNVNGQGVGQVVRYDTLSTFGAACAWSSFDISTLNASATNYFGAVYDGQYLYLAPKGTWVARFETKSASAMPQLPAFNGSFY